MTSTSQSPVVANHHAHHPGFAGVSGFVAGLTMTLGRGAVGRLAVDLANVTGDDYVVDVGCGPGSIAREAAQRGAHVVGVDPAIVMLKLARRLTGDATTITWLDGTAEKLPLTNAAATVLWSISTVHHWTNVEAGLAEAHRVLARGGRLLVIERASRPGARGLASHGWTGEQAGLFTKMCDKARFTDLSVATHRAGRKALHLVQATRP
jgi:ubiquinone/menaquinone biosynthesis C-methylase UbiE